MSGFMREINTVDIYCQVIDNYGDAGVCWRLARSLAQHGLAVTLWIDDIARLAALRPTLKTDVQSQGLDGFMVRAWEAQTAPHQPPDLVIEAFGCRMPAAQLTAMAAMSNPPVWINLEYLSAEAWVDEHHGLPSPHSSLPLTRYFFFPGFDLGSGGLIREQQLLAERQAFDTAARDAFLARLGIELAPADTLVSVFCYPSAPLTELLQAFHEGPPLLCVFPGGLPYGYEALPAGALRLQALPFLEPDDYDRLLWSCDLNFVRGEDSAVRAQWAGQPFIWQFYEQAEGAHHVKRDAFLRAYLAAFDDDLAGPVRAAWQHWNGETQTAADWSALVAALPRWRVHARAWAEQLGNQSDLASRLLGFARKIR
jgi:uncharacterized repeat protein (TIGR03837 family)